MNYVAIRALIKNDLRIYRTDRRAMILGVLVPILIAAFFGYVFGGNGSSGPARIPIAVVDLDQSAISHAIAGDLPQDTLLMAANAPPTVDRAQAEGQVRSGKVHVAIVIPPHFAEASSRALADGTEKPEVELLVDPTEAMSGQIVESVLLRDVLREIARGAGSASREPSAPYAIATTRVTAGSKIPYNGYAHSFAGMTTQFILLSGIDSGIALLMLRERGIWQRVRAAPLGKAQFLLARTCATMLISLFQLTLIYTVAIAVFGVRIEGSVLGFLSMALMLCFTNSALGLMLASLGRSASATRGIAIFVTLLLVMIGGAWVPSFVFPAWLQRASLVAPTRWAVDGLDAMTWRGQGLHAALAPAGVLAVTAMLCLGVAIWRFRWEE